LLYDSVSIWDGLRFKSITKQYFESEYKITPEQYVDIGALMGDNGDAIQSIPSWGDKTALEEIQKHGSYKNVLDCYIKKYSHLEDKFPEIESMLDLESLRLQKTKSGKQKYPDVYYGMPFSGVALAIEWKKIDPIPQKAIMLLMYQERLDVAYSLKKVDDDINSLPEIKEKEQQIDKLKEYFDRYGIKSLEKDIYFLFNKEEKIVLNPCPEKEIEVNEQKEKSTLFDF
jgi:5'-3' exonuclease